MTLTEHNRSARKRGELSTDRGSRRISQTVAAKRRLHTRLVDGTRFNRDSSGLRDPRHAYLTRSYE